MKKALVLTLALILAISLTLLGGCSLTSLIKDNGGSDDGGKSQDGDSGGEEKFEYGEDYIASKLTGDYSITYKITVTGEEEDSATITSIRTSAGYYLSSDGSEMLFIRDGEKYYMYSGSAEDGFTKVDYVEFTQDEVELYFMVFNGYTTQYASFASEMKKSGTETVAGRNCDKYSFDYSLFGVKMQYDASIDKETGVCLKWKYDMAAGGQSGGVSFECTEFKTSGVSLPSYQ